MSKKSFEEIDEASLSSVVASLSAVIDELKEEVTSLRSDLQRADEALAVRKSSSKLLEDRIICLESLLSSSSSSSSSSSPSSPSPPSSPAKSCGPIKIARRWRFVLFIGGLLSLSLTLRGYLISSERLAWSAWLFWIFSCVCLLMVVVGDVRSFNKGIREKVTVVMCGVIIGLGPTINGMTLKNIEDEATAKAGRNVFMIGIASLLLFPPVTYRMGSKYSTLSDRELGAALMTLFKTLPSILGSILYISGASMRCILAASDSDAIFKQAGNPILPSNYISCLIALSWIFGRLLPPINKNARQLTWRDIMSLKMDRVEGSKFSLFGVASTVVVLMFSLLDEEGSELSPIMNALRFVYLMAMLFLIILINVEAFVIPLICPKSRSLALSSSSDPNNDDIINAFQSPAGL